MHRHWEGGWERKSEVTGWGLEKKGRAKEGRKKKEECGENRELVGLGRFVKIPRTTYKLHRSIVEATVTTWLESAKSLYVRSRRCVRCSRVRVWAIRREVPREIQFAGNVLRGASRKPVEPDKLVIEQRIFLSFSGGGGSTVALPFVPRDPIARGDNRVRYIKSGSNYCDRRELILATCPSNVSSSRNSVSASLSLFLYFSASRRLNIARSTRYIS